MNDILFSLPSFIFHGFRQIESAVNYHGRGSVNDWSVKIYLILLGPLCLCVCLINCVLRLSWDCFPIIGVVLTGQWLKPPSLGIKVMSAF